MEKILSDEEIDFDELKESLEFISTLEKKLTTSEKQSSDSEVLSDEKQSSDSEVLSENFKNAKKLFGDYSVGNTIKDAIESMYNCYEAYMTQ